MRVRIHDPRRDILAASINHGGARWRVHAFTDGRDLAVLDVNRTVLDVAVRHGHDDGIRDYDVLVRCSGGCLPKHARTRKREQCRERPHAKNKCADKSHAMNSKMQSVSEFGL